MFCNKCGTQLEDSAAFCNKCGAPVVIIEKQDDAENDDATKVLEPVDSGSVDVSVVDRDVAPVQAVVTPAPSPTPVSAPAVAAASLPVDYKAKNRRTGAIAAGTVGVLALVGVGFLAYTLFLAPFNIDEKTFPDAALRSYVAKTIDTDGDGKVTRDEAKEVKSINLSGSKIASLVGMEVFKNLTELDLSGTPLTEANLSSYKQLEKLDASGSALQSIDLGVKPEFEYLDLSETKVSEVNLSSCNNLKKVNLSKTPVEKVDASECGVLEDLDLSDTSVSELVIGGRETLQRANLSNTKLSGLDASGCTALQELDLQGSSVTEVNTSGCTALTNLNLDGSQAASVNVDGCTSLADFNVAEDVAIEGLESAGLREQWLLLELDSTGYANLRLESLGLDTHQSSESFEHFFVYDDKYRLVEHTLHQSSSGSDTKKVSSYEYQGDSSKPTTKSTTYSDDLVENRYYNIFSYTYDDSGHPEKIVSRATSSEWPYYFEYDDSGNLIEANSGSSSSTFEYRDGKLIKIESLGDKYSASQSLLCDYNEGGLVTKLDYKYDYSNQMKIIGTVEYEYDSESRCVKSTQSMNYGKDTDDQVSVMVFSYDEKGNMVSAEIQGKDGISESTALCEYDDYGNVIRQENKSSDNTQVFEYRYQRIITPIDTEDIICPIVANNPLTLVYEKDIAFDYAFLEGQSPIVQNKLYVNTYSFWF